MEAVEDCYQAGEYDAQIGQHELNWYFKANWAGSSVGKADAHTDQQSGN